VPLLRSLLIRVEVDPRERPAMLAISCWASVHDHQPIAQVAEALDLQIGDRVAETGAVLEGLLQRTLAQLHHAHRR
jgi:hypothetical protein